MLEIMGCILFIILFSSLFFTYKMGMLKANLISPKERLIWGIIKMISLFGFIQGLAYIKYRNYPFSKQLYDLYCKIENDYAIKYNLGQPRIFCNAKYLNENGVNDFVTEYDEENIKWEK